LLSSGFCKMRSHDAPLAWNSRNAPLRKGNVGSALTWRERAALHRAELGLHKPAVSMNAILSREMPQLDVTLNPEEVANGDPPINDIGMLTADISAADLIVTDDLVLATEVISHDAVDEGYCDDDWWGQAMRVDLERFMAYKNVQLRVAAQEDMSLAPIFECSSAWRIVSEIVVWERNVLRRCSRGQEWPDTMLSPAVLSRDQVEELKGIVERCTTALEDLDDINSLSLRTTLQLLPVDFVLQQLIADALMAAGETEEARYALLLVVGAATHEKKPELRVGQAQFAPPRIGWDDRCKCDYVKAQQCARFGRLAVISAQAIAAQPDAEEYTPELTRLRSEQRRTALTQELASGQRHLIDARKLYKAELAALTRLSEQQANGPTGNYLFGAREVNSFRIALRCGYLGATALLASIYSLGGRIAETHATYDEAIRDASALLCDAAATPHLQRLLAAEREKMMQDRSRLQSK